MFKVVGAGTRARQGTDAGCDLDRVGHDRRAGPNLRTGNHERSSHRGRGPGESEGGGDIQPSRGDLLRLWQDLHRLDPRRRHAARARIHRMATGTDSGRSGSTTPSLQTLTLLFESPSRTVLELPDNIGGQPEEVVLLCEDGPVENYMRGVTPGGDLRLRAQRHPATHGRGVRRGDLHSGRPGAVREHPGVLGPDIRDLGSMGEGGAVVATRRGRQGSPTQSLRPSPRHPAPRPRSGRPWPRRPDALGGEGRRRPARSARPSRGARGCVRSPRRSR